MNTARTALVIAFIALGGLFAVSANATVWANRTIFDTDRFVSTVNNALDDEEVQQQLALRLSTALIEQGQVEQRLNDALPQELGLLAPILTRQAEGLVYDICLRVIQSPAVGEAFDIALRTVHQQVLYILEGEGAVIFQDDQVVIDLQVILKQAAEELGLSGDGLLANIELPDDAGQIVLIEDAKNADSVRDLIALHNQITWIVVGLAVAAFAIAVAIARDRRTTISRVGIVLAICGILAVTVLFPVRPIVSGLARNEAVGRAVFDAFTEAYRVQSLILIAFGLLIAFVAFIFGESELARAVRGSFRRDSASTSPALSNAIRSNAGVLRAIGFGAGALTLAAWPEPSNRFYVTTLLLIGVYFGGLWVITGGSRPAEVIRGWFSNLGSLGAGETNTNSFAGRNANALRLAGIVGAVVAAIVVPNLGMGAFAAIVALTLLYFALIEWMATRTS